MRLFNPEAALMSKLTHFELQFYTLESFSLEACSFGKEQVGVQVAAADTGPSPRRLWLVVVSSGGGNESRQTAVEPQLHSLHKCNTSCS